MGLNRNYLAMLFGILSNQPQNRSYTVTTHKDYPKILSKKMTPRTSKFKGSEEVQVQV